MKRDGSGAPYRPIRDYALIGDCHGSALVSTDCAVDWACLARFDSGSIFGRLLDAERGGTFALSARDRTGVSRRYLPDTNVLETRVTTRTGVATVLDLFPMRRGGRNRPLRQLLRVVDGVEGEVTFDVLVQPRFDYGSLRPWLRWHGDERTFSAVGGDDAFVLSADVPLRIDREEVALRGEVTVGPRQRRRFALSAQRPHEMDLSRTPARELDRRARRTVAWWNDWVGKGRYVPAYRDAMVRSALVLKLLTCAPTGAIIAAPTTSLPEQLGGTRNWDYRYSWVRDSTLTLAALLEVGHHEVATGFKLFIERATAGHAEDLQILYGCYGERRLPELELDWLSGYHGSRPVRVGNGAAEQRQHDVFGELLHASHLWRRAGNPMTEDGWRFLTSLVEAVCAHWREPDRGIWEVRGPPQHFVHSKVMCWLALDAGIHAAVEDELPADLERWRSVRDEIRSAIERDGVDRERGCFVQAFGSKALDASLLLLPAVGFVRADDPRMQRTVELILDELCVDGLVRRYRPEQVADGVTGSEGAFLMATFWLVDVLAMQGKVEEAERRFDALLRLGSDLGLFSEEYDPKRGELLGNYPQAFTHMALINSAAQLSRARGGTGVGERTADRERPQCERDVSTSTLHHRRRRRRAAAR